MSSSTSYVLLSLSTLRAGFWEGKGSAGLGIGTHTEHLLDSMERAAICERSLQRALQLQARFDGVRRVCLAPLQIFNTVHMQKAALTEETGEV